MNKQRETIYGLRRQLMEEPDQRDYLMGDPPKSGVAYDLLSDLTKQYLNPEAPPDDWDVENYKIQIKTIYDFDTDSEGINFSELRIRGSDRHHLGETESQVCGERKTDWCRSDAHI